MRGVVPQATFGYFNAPAAFAFEERAAAGGWLYTLADDAGAVEEPERAL